MGTPCAPEPWFLDSMSAAVSSRNASLASSGTLRLIDDYTALRTEHRELEKRVAQLDKEAAELRGECLDLREQLEAEKEAGVSNNVLQAVEAEKKALSEETATLLKEGLKVKDDLLGAKLQLQAAKEEAEDREAELDKTISELSQERSKVEAAEEELSRIRAAHELATAEIESRMRMAEEAEKRAEVAESQTRDLEQRLLEAATTQAAQMDAMVDEWQIIEAKKRELEAKLAAVDAAAAAAGAAKADTTISKMLGGRDAMSAVLPSMPYQTVDLAHTGGCAALAYSSSGMILASCGMDRTVKTWDADTGAPLSTLTGMTGGVNDVAFSCDSKMLVAGGSDKSVRAWDASSGRSMHTLQGHTDKVVAVDCHPSEAGRAVSGGIDRCMKLWDLSRGVIMKSIMVHSNIADVCYSHCGTLLCSAHFDGTVRFWDWRTASGLAQPAGAVEGAHTQPMLAAARSAGRPLLVTAARDNLLKLIDLAPRFELRRTYRSPGGAGRGAAGIGGISISPDDRYLVAGTAQGSLAVWDVETCKLEADLTRGHTHAVQAVAWNPNGNSVASGDKHGQIVLWR